MQKLEEAVRMQVKKETKQQLGRTLYKVSLESDKTIYFLPSSLSSGKCGHWLPVSFCSLKPVVKALVQNTIMICMKCNGQTWIL